MWVTCMEVYVNITKTSCELSSLSEGKISIVWAYPNIKAGDNTAGFVNSYTNQTDTYSHFNLQIFAKGYLKNTRTHK